MSRITIPLAAHIADSSRPRQTVRDQQLQREQAQQTKVDAIRSGSDDMENASDVRLIAAQLKKVVEATSGWSLDFSIDEDAQLSYVSVRDKSSGEVIRQIPSEEVRAMKARIDEMIGMMFNEQA